MDPGLGTAATQPPARGSAREVFLAFVKLGVTSFGGPVAHLGYFRGEFVQRRRWIDDASYSDLVALCQFLPGPASSQVGMALGLLRAGWLGALAAWSGFTLPSALALALFAFGLTHSAGATASGVIHGLLVVAVAVVAQAVWGMARSLCTDVPRAAIALAAAILALALPGFPGQAGALVAGGVAGCFLVPPSPTSTTPGAYYPVSRRAGAALLAACGTLLVVLPALAAWSASFVLAAVAVFFQAGALVFGGGHVVLPLLQAGVVPPGWISNDVFLAGYGAAQAVPGPLFSFAAYLGAVMPAPLGGWVGALVLLAAIFAPAFLLVAGALPFWAALRRHGAMRRALAGINAAVVGILAAALYDPVWTSAIHSPADLGVALAAFLLLTVARASAVVVVAGTALAGVLLA